MPDLSRTGIKCLSKIHYPKVAPQSQGKDLVSGLTHTTRREWNKDLYTTQAVGLIFCLDSVWCAAACKRSPVPDCTASSLTGSVPTAEVHANTDCNQHNAHNGEHCCKSNLSAMTQSTRVWLVLLTARGWLGLRSDIPCCWWCCCTRNTSLSHFQIHHVFIITTPEQANQRTKRTLWSTKSRKHWQGPDFAFATTTVLRMALPIFAKRSWLWTLNRFHFTFHWSFCCKAKKRHADCVQGADCLREKDGK